MRQNDDLVRRGNVHVEPLFGDRSQFRAAGGVADLTVELHALGLERLTSSIEIAQRARLVDAVRPPCNDARGHEDETKENQSDH